MGKQRPKRGGNPRPQPKLPTQPVTPPAQPITRPKPKPNKK